MRTREHGRVPALILKVGQYPLHSGGVAAVRTLGRLAEALVDLNAVLAAQPDLPEGLNNRGNVLRELKQFDEALADFTAALALQ